MGIPTIGVIGRGFVGGAVVEGFRKTHKIVSYDKAKGWLSSDPCPVQFSCVLVVSGTEVVAAIARGGPIFVCVPTPMMSDGSCDTSIVEEVVNAAAVVPGAAICIKSTVPPGTTARLQAKYPQLRLSFNPEFLREATAVEDFLTQRRIIVGGEPECRAAVTDAYCRAFPSAVVIQTDSTTAELVKYIRNVFLACKVSLTNEFRLVADALELSWSEVSALAMLDERLGKSHWSVPGPDGNWGFGGSCFPKDINAFIALAKSLDVAPLVAEAAWERNLAQRPDRDWEELKGRAVA